jgi:hypothetical protein
LATKTLIICGRIQFSKAFLKYARLFLTVGILNVGEEKGVEHNLTRKIIANKPPPAPSRGGYAQLDCNTNNMKKTKADYPK